MRAFVFTTDSLLAISVCSILLLSIFSLLGSLQVHTRDYFASDILSAYENGAEVEQIALAFEKSNRCGSLRIGNETHDFCECENALVNYRTILSDENGTLSMRIAELRSCAR